MMFKTVAIFTMSRLHPFGGSSRHPGRSLSPTRGSIRSAGGEGGSEKENQSYTTSSLQLLGLMDTLFSR